MNPSPWQTQRRMVPRWRSLTATLKSSELGIPTGAVGKSTEPRPISPSFLRSMERWNLDPSLVTAAELVEASIVEGRENDAIEAARRLVSIDRNAAPLIREQAASLLARTGNAEDIPTPFVRPTISRVNPRLLTRLHPYDPLAWVELALHQTIRGSSEAAVRSMTIALNLAPHNRHVLRSAARLFLHRNDPERALATVARNSATKTDPWLIASEISLAQVADRTSRFLKIGNLMISENGVNPKQITELAGAIATEELVHGNRKKARRSFTQSLADPTGSSLAQGEWASSALGGELVSESSLDSTFENAEAKAFHLFRMGRLQDVAGACYQWAENDPFSVRPFEFGAVTAGYIEDFDAALQFAQRGLELRPTLPSLLNAMAFAAASLNRTEEAAAAMAKFKPADATKVQQLVAAANKGLIAYRNGDGPGGRASYSEAIEGFRRDGEHELAARAKIYLAREAMLANTSDWQELLKEAQNATGKFKDSEIIPILRRIEKAAEERRNENRSEAVSTERTVKAPAVSVRVSFSPAQLSLPLPKN